MGRRQTDRETDVTYKVGQTDTQIIILRTHTIIDYLLRRSSIWYGP